jgi:hypothetical protein
MMIDRYLGLPGIVGQLPASFSGFSTIVIDCRFEQACHFRHDGRCLSNGWTDDADELWRHKSRQVLTLG